IATEWPAPAVWTTPPASMQSSSVVAARSMASERPSTAPSSSRTASLIAHLPDSPATLGSHRRSTKHVPRTWHVDFLSFGTRPWARLSESGCDSARQAEPLRAVRRRARPNGRLHLDVSNLRARHLGGVVVEQHEVGDHARGQRPAHVLLTGGVGGVDGEGAQGRLRVDALLLREHGTALRGPLDHRTHAEQRGT